MSEPVTVCGEVDIVSAEGLTLLLVGTELLELEGVEAADIRRFLALADGSRSAAEIDVALARHFDPALRDAVLEPLRARLFVPAAEHRLRRAPWAVEASAAGPISVVGEGRLADGLRQWLSPRASEPDDDSLLVFAPDGGTYGKLLADVQRRVGARRRWLAVTVDREHITVGPCVVGPDPESFLQTRWASRFDRHPDVGRTDVLDASIHRVHCVHPDHPDHASAPWMTRVVASVSAMARMSSREPSVAEVLDRRGQTRIDVDGRTRPKPDLQLPASAFSWRSLDAAPDPDATAEVDAAAARALLREAGAEAIEHAVGSFYEHLTGTARILDAWGAPRAVQWAGAFHSVYSTSAFSRRLLEPWQRPLVAAHIGDDAEQLAFLFCTLDRAAMRRDLLAQPQRNHGADLWNFRTGESRMFGPAVVDALVLLEAANLFEQTAADDRGPAPVLLALQRLARVVSPATAVPSFLRAVELPGAAEELALLAAYREGTDPSVSWDRRAAALQTAIEICPGLGEPYLAYAEVLADRDDPAAQHFAEAACTRLLDAGAVWDHRVTWHDALLRAHRLHGSDTGAKVPGTVRPRAAAV